MQVHEVLFFCLTFTVSAKGSVLLDDKKMDGSAGQIRGKWWVGLLLCNTGNTKLRKASQLKMDSLGSDPTMHFWTEKVALVNGLCVLLLVCWACVRSSKMQYHWHLKQTKSLKGCILILRNISQIIGIEEHSLKITDHSLKFSQNSSEFYIKFDVKIDNWRCKNNIY